MIELNDHEILKLEKISKWAESQAGSRRDIDQFTKDIRERINHIGLEAEVKVMETDQEGVYAFEVEINGRVGGSVFDPDRQVHEVTSNLLDLPGQDKGFIKSREYLDKLVQRERAKGHKH